MSDEQLNHHTDPTGLVMSAKAAAGANYLGDRDVVDRLVRDFASGVLARFEKVGDGLLTPNDAAEQDKAECLRMEQVFTGNDPAYSPMPGWTTGSLEMYVKARMKETIQPDSGALAQAFAMLAHVIYDAIRNAGDPQDMGKQINDGIQSFTLLLLGIEHHD